ncbi:Putative serine esterase (DUF676), putative [Angomonas deanei]|uniref:Serine esterase (DUF676), putative n=1 Tax=Angomonas deanei TaxID=59799 RepID=A0A7G2CHD9_9TRYP|nr:Putative serine esterase (DUF676), putative [Angomonas deanei]
MTSVQMHFIVLQHGYHGTEKDMDCLYNRLMTHAGNTAQSDHLTFVLNSNVNHGLKTDQGVLVCARRLVEYVTTEVTERVQRYEYKHVEVKNTDDSGGLNLSLRFSFVGHSMGGLIIRAALPPLVEYLQSAYEGNPEAPHIHLAEEGKVVLDTFYSIAVPHLGVAHMPSLLKASLGRQGGRLLSQGLYDMNLESTVVTEELVQPRYTDYLTRFRRRVLFSATNDDTVMGYSSVFGLNQKEVDIFNSRGEPTEGTVLLPSEPASTLEELKQRKVTITRDVLDRWPAALLPKERALAARLLPAITPAELHTVDLQKRASDYVSTHRLSFFERMRVHFAANHFAHRALVAKTPAAYPDIFGFVSQYIQEDVLNAQS